MADFQPLWGNNPNAFEALDRGAGPTAFEAIGPWATQAAPPAPEPEPGLESVEFEPGTPAPPPPVAVEEPEPVDLSAIQQAAHDEAFEQGLAEGKAQAAQMLASAEDLLLQLQGLRAEFFNRAVRDTADCILHIARQVVHAELGVSSEGVQDLVQQVLAEVTADDDVVIRLAPEDDRAMRDAYPRLLESLGRDGTFRVELDGGLHPGGAIIETSYGRIDASVEAQLAAFAEGIEAWAQAEVEIGDE